MLENNSTVVVANGQLSSFRNKELFVKKVEEKVVDCILVLTGFQNLSGKKALANSKFRHNQSIEIGQ